MISAKLQSFRKSRCCTLLGVGPMSKNCVDATIEIANEFDVPLMLIASRRQIECREMGGGYVNNWSTEEFADYVIRSDKKSKVVLARDHGGPWQNPLEVKQQMSLRLAMDSAKKSYDVDIESGLQVIHIDPSIDIHGQPSVQEVLDRIFELYEHCCATARRLNKDILFEIGTEEQSGLTNSVEELEFVLSEVQKFCQANSFPLPTFVVMQTGTRVMEMRNVGSFDSPFRVAGDLPAELQVPRMLDLCKKYQILMKEHNTDYLSDESLSWHPRLGIHAANVAPEFGVAESKAFYHLLATHSLENLATAFLDLALTSKKYEKWLVPNSQASDKEKAMICGHYVFATSQFQEIKKQAAVQLEAKKIDIDSELKKTVKQSIMRYVRHFKLAELE